MPFRALSRLLVREQNPADGRTAYAVLTSDYGADPVVRAVIMTGAGTAFSAGGHPRMMQEVVDGLYSPDDDGAFKPFLWIKHQFGALARLITRSDEAFISAVNGPAAGAGPALAVASDVVVASSDAVLVPAFGRLALVPEVGTSWALTRALGYRGAFAFYANGGHPAPRRLNG